MSQVKESTAKLTGVAETLTITLYARSVETLRQDAILKDEKAVEIAEKLDYDFEKYSQGWASQLGCVIRARVYDRAVSNFLQTHPTAIVVNLGAGLCTRFFRIDNGEVQWYEVDFPEVIELKRKLVTPSDRYQLISSSLLDAAWISKINRAEDRPVLMIMEGVSMYLTASEVRTLFQQIHQQFSPVEMLFDVLSSKRAKNTQAHDTVSKTNAQFSWGIDNSQELETWNVGIRVKEEIYYLTEFAKYPHRLQPWWLKYLTPILVPLYKKSGRILRVEIGR
ncbi:class I SAM-dependent methyltransferase [Chroococcidiopsidales cyanobacterium LEGE 13417]|nr:class I SAM-dependent methyltransferase [Chroococcidiopsidales cyanobacterium LEGE 13417]